MELLLFVVAVSLVFARAFSAPFSLLGKSTLPIIESFLITA